MIEDEHHLILDGHHRFEVAKKMGLKKVPVITLHYKDIEIWSLRPEEKVTHELVVEKALNHHIYPNKTVKHDFPFKVPECQISIKELY